MTHISDIKLIRTDTTLDLSQKAEKGMSFSSVGLIFYSASPPHCFLVCPMWDYKAKTIDDVEGIVKLFAENETYKSRNMDSTFLAMHRY
ncbi:hypothetical protein Lal_00013233 [Lupinus albus]|nr:hypothetical protein Lal_00013233 [Lupinus albus]